MLSIHRTLIFCDLKQQSQSQKGVRLENQLNYLNKIFKNIMAHTILLVQPDVNPETRTYSDYESVNECMEGVCKIYEEHLKKRNPNTPTITYDISQLFDFVDQLSDLSCLVYQKSTNTYAPYNKDWIKEKIYILLRQAAGHPNGR